MNRRSNATFGIRAPALSPALLAFLLLFSMSSIAADSTLAWDPVSAPDVAGYMLHYGTVSGNYANHIDVGNQTAHVLTGLALGNAYYAVVTSYDLGRAESSPSNEIGWIPLQTGNRPAPLPTPSSTVTSSVASQASSGGSGGGGGCVADPGRGRDATLSLLLAFLLALRFVKRRHIASV